MRAQCASSTNFNVVHLEALLISQNMYLKKHLSAQYALIAHFNNTKWNDVYWKIITHVLLNIFEVVLIVYDEILQNYEGVIIKYKRNVLLFT